MAPTKPNTQNNTKHAEHLDATYIQKKTFIFINNFFNDFSKKC